MHNLSDQLPDLPDVQHAVGYLAVHAGLPGLFVGIIVWMYGNYQAGKSYVDSAVAVIGAFGRTSDAVRRVVGERKQAAASLGIYSAATVAISYILTLVINALIIIYKNNYQGITSWSAVESTMSGSRWPPAAGWTIAIEACVIGLYLLAMSADLNFLRGLISFIILVTAFACLVAFGGMVCAFLGTLLAPAHQNLGNNREALMETQAMLGLICLALAALLKGVYMAARRTFRP
jgi:hypothetical protein